MGPLLASLFCPVKLCRALEDKCRPNTSHCPTALPAGRALEGAGSASEGALGGAAVSNYYLVVYEKKLFTEFQSGNFCNARTGSNASINRISSVFEGIRKECSSC